MTNGQNFKKGDRVAAEDAKYSGIVTEVCDMGCKVRFADGEELFFLNDILHHSDLPDYDRRTDFLRKLGALLREFDARIGYFIGDDEKYGWSDYPFLKVGKETIKYPAGEIDEINADNIMDFDKD